MSNVLGASTQTTLPNIVSSTTSTVNNVSSTSVTLYGPLASSTDLIIIVGSQGGRVLSASDSIGNTYVEDASIIVNNPFSTINDFLTFNVLHAESIVGGNNVSITIEFDQTVDAADIQILNIANNGPLGSANLNITYNTTNGVSVNNEVIDANSLAILIGINTSSPLEPITFNNSTNISTLQDPNGIVGTTVSYINNPGVGTLTITGQVPSGVSSLVWISGLLIIQPLAVAEQLGNLGTVPTLSNQVQSQVGTYRPIQNGSSTAITTTPHIAATIYRNVDQTGAASAYSCASRALKNAKQIQSLTLQNSLPLGFNPQFSIEQEPLLGYFSILDLSGPSNINRIKPEVGFGFDFLGTFVNIVNTQVSAQKAFAPVFNGTIHIFQITYNNGTSTFQVATPDMQTIQNFLNKARIPIQAYTSQYGNTGINIDSTIYQYTFNISGNTFNDQDLAGNPQNNSPGLIDNIAQQFGFTNPLGDCILIVGAPGVTNTTANPAQGVLGYHSASVVNNVPYIYFGLTSGGLTPQDTADKYQLVASHETAEMSVDPGANLANPEVCDPCGPNCDPVWRDFFDSNNNYLFSSAFFPPVQSYDYFINAIIQPQYTGQYNDLCMTPPFACAYAPPGTSNTFPFIPGTTQLPLPVSPNQLQIIIPGGVDTGQLVSTPFGMKVIKFPLKGV